MNPTVKDISGWRFSIIEHRRQLFERVVAAFPELLTSVTPKVELWRKRLSNIRTPAGL